MNSSVFFNFVFKEIKPLLKCKTIINLKITIMQHVLLTIAFILSSIFIANSQESKSNAIGTITEFENNEIAEVVPIFFLVLIEENYSKFIVNDKYATLKIKF